MKHDEHFLRRIDRLNAQHSELALGLWRDPDLVREILREVQFPKGQDRAVLALEDQGQGPYVVLARNGHFVTCLGRGMRLRRTDFLVPRRILDAIGERVGCLRRLMQQIKDGSEKHTKRLIKRLTTAGDKLSLEEFQELARWLPLMREQFLHMAVVKGRRRQRILNVLATCKHVGPRYEKLLKAYWRDTWTFGHLCALLASDGGVHLDMALSHFEALSGERYPLELLVLEAVNTGVCSIAQRGLWLASRLPARTAAGLAALYRENRTWREAMAAGAALAAIGIRYPKRRPHVNAVLGYQDAKARAGMSTYVNLTRTCVNRIYSYMAAQPEARRKELCKGLNDYVAGLVAHTSDTPLCLHVPQNIVVAVCTQAPTPLYADSTPQIAALMQWTPWIASARAEDFYLPRTCCDVLARPWRFEQGMTMLEPAIAAVKEQRAVTRINHNKVQRNQACPCGSGKKHKHCCLHAPVQVAA